MHNKNKTNLSISALVLLLSFFSLSYFSTVGTDFSEQSLSGDALTMDEIPHIGSGYYYLTTGRYFLNTEHPPLVKDIAALPLLALDLNSPDFSQEKNKGPVPEPMSLDMEIENHQMRWATIFLFSSDNDADQIARLSRLSVILTNTLLLFLLFLLLRKVTNPQTSLLMLSLLTFSPFILAHASLVTMDMMSSLLQMLTLVSFSLYLQTNKQQIRFDKYFWLTLIFLSLANLAKFSSVMIFPALITGALIYFSTQNRFFKAFKLTLFNLLALGLGMLFLISCFYAYHTRNTLPQELVLQIQRLYLPEFPASGKDILEKIAYLHPLGRGLVQYIMGLCMVFWRLTRSHQITYFMGRVFGAEGCGFWYFPILYLTKLPLAFLGANLAAVIALLQLYRKKTTSLLKQIVTRPLVIILLSFAYFYLVLALQTTLNIGLRHIMPVILAVSILSAIATHKLWNQRIFTNIRLKECFIVCTGLLIFVTLKSSPHFLSYYNAIGGGSDKGYQIATDSNYDWGQDITRLADWIRQNNIHQIYTDIFSNIDLNYYISGKVIAIDTTQKNDLGSGEYLAVSVFNLQNNIFAEDENLQNNFDQLTKNLIQKVGKTIFVFKIP